MEKTLDEEALRQKTNEIIAELYGVDNSVSEEEVRTLIALRQMDRRGLARRLAESSELSGFSPAELVTYLGINTKAPEASEAYLLEFVFACKDLHKKGYGQEIQRVLTTDGMFGRKGDEPFPSPMWLVRMGDISRLRDLIFSLPQSTTAQTASGD